MDFNIYQFAAQYGLGWVVSKNQIVYLKPAFLVETVVIDSTLLKLNETGLLIEMKMWNEQKDKLKSVMWTNLVHINIKKQKIETHSQELLKTFRLFENPLDENIGFDERIEQLRNM